MDLLDRLRALQAGARDYVVLPYTPATKSTQLVWIAPDEDVWEDFSELEDVSDELDAYLPLGTVELGADTLRILVVQREAPHAVSIYYEGFRPVAASLEAFEAALLEKGEEPPAATLDAVCTAAGVRIDAGDYAVAVAMLTPALARHPREPDDRAHRALREQLAAGWTDLGVAHHELGDDRAATDAYEVAVKWGSKAAQGNLLTLAIDGKRWPEARALAEELLSGYKPPAELSALRTKLLHVLAELGEHDAAVALATKHVSYLHELTKIDHAQAVTLQTQLLAALAASPREGRSQEVVDAARVIIEPPLPPPGAAEVITLRDIMAASRLIRAGKVVELRALLERLPDLVKEADITQVIDELPASPTKSEIEELVMETLLG